MFGVLLFVCWLIGVATGLSSLEGFTVAESARWWKENGVGEELAGLAAGAIADSGAESLTPQQLTRVHEALVVAGQTFDSYSRALHYNAGAMTPREFDATLRRAQGELDTKIRTVFTPITPEYFRGPRPCHLGENVFNHILRGICLPFPMFEACRRVLEDTAHIPYHHHLHPSYPARFPARVVSGGPVMGGPVVSAPVMGAPVVSPPVLAAPVAGYAPTPGYPVRPALEFIDPDSATATFAVLILVLGLLL